MTRRGATGCASEYRDYRAAGEHPDGGQNLKEDRAFHNAAYHRDPRYSCSQCHRSHVRAPMETTFLVGASVKPICDQCHQAILGIPAR